MSRGPPSTTHDHTCNGATTTTNRQQPPNKHTQIEIPPGKHVFQSKTNPIMTDANPATTKETIPDTAAQTQHDANWGHKTAETRDRTGDLQIFSLTLSQLSYRGR